MDVQLFGCIFQLSPFSKRSNFSHSYLGNYLSKFHNLKYLIETINPFVETA